MKSNLTKKCVLSGIMVCLIIVLAVNSIFAASAVLSWSPPTTNADGTELNDLAGYRVYYGTESGNYSESIVVGNVVTYEVNNLSAGATYYFATSAYNTAGKESQSSDEINKTFSALASPEPVNYYCDNDNDGFAGTSINGSCTGASCEPEGCQTTPGNDCNDSIAMINPHAVDVCGNGIDEDCGGGDEVCLLADIDIDGYTEDVDCDDTNAAINPGEEDSSCNGIDEDCDGVADDDYASQTVQCGIGECASTGLMICDNGQVEDTCTVQVPPEATEAKCYDGLDNDCDGTTDSADEDCYIPDADGDGYTEDVDCDDSDAVVNPGATDICGNSIDEDCSGADEACTMSDNDGDGYTEDVDCDDYEAMVNPGAVEDCTDGVDNDCNGLIDTADPSALNCPYECEDLDMDGYAVEGGDCGPVDCDDSNAYINPSAAEVCDDGIDNDCDGSSDCGDDPDCDTAQICGPLCYPEKEICGDKIDNDCDGTIDCDDFNCRRNSLCIIKEICDDGIDNDDNGKIDCYDPKCRREKVCKQ